MSPISRRSLIGTAAAVGTGAALGAVPLRAATAQAATTGTIADVKHVVILMQENRSFDHYFGTLQGVRGFGDRAAIQIPGGYSVFDQPNGSSRQYPWNLSNGSGNIVASAETLAQCDGSLDHGWSTQHEAWDGGKMDDWISAKGSNRTMGYLTRGDVPFHYGLADAYTICDAYHCSILSATGPNRTYLWSGMIDPNGTAGGPAYDGGSESGLGWQTYAETLQDAGVSWKVYQVASDNFGDNALAYFSQFANAASGTPLYLNGMSSVSTSAGSTPLDIAAAIKNDVVNGTLPQVSWVVANQQCSEHPDAPPEDGAQFVNEVLQALAADSTVFNSTVLFLNYDENDGFFDHVPPPVPPAGTANEFIQSGTPIGLGYRVPMIIASPWTRGGYVDSQTYDHTSVIRFLETWTNALGTPAVCPNISAWRREVCGDLTGAFNFASPVYGLPTTLPATTSTISQTLCDIELNPSAKTNALPAQESGTRSARALPYQPDGYVSSLQFGSNGQILLWLKMANEGVQATSAATFAVYANADRSGGPWQYTVPAYSASTGDGVVTDYFNIGTGYGAGAYDLTMTGPNRFLRRFVGNATTAGQYAEVTSHYAPSTNLGEQSIWFTMTNTGTAAVTFTITSTQYRTDGPWTYSVAAGASVSDYFNQVAYCNGWYDFTVTVSSDASWSRRFTGHIETGAVSVTG
ncbi:phospholipase C, phosphocholine-specific [Actinospica durhamensis]|uniref:phospholipase C n=1 Tax=Actinospica durhamensis TaxID=1508375 RepID=A0A941EUZ3_9ACTN|nr:phospholipase C, phosphocholine-specific [Actinospica durhamensis]